MSNEWRSTPEASRKVAGVSPKATTGREARRGFYIAEGGPTPEASRKVAGASPKATTGREARRASYIA